MIYIYSCTNKWIDPKWKERFLELGCESCWVGVITLAGEDGVFVCMV